MARVALIYDYVREEEKRILRALLDVGFEVVQVNVLKHVFDLSEEPGFDAAVIRPVSMYHAAYAAALMEGYGALTINPSFTIVYAGDKILSYSLLRRSKLPIPRTVIVVDSSALEEAARRIGYPLVDKPPIGSWGRLVTLIRDDQQLRSVKEHRDMMVYKQMRAHILQEYVPTGSSDIRCLVVDGETLGCIRRIAGEGEWRSNVALGGRVEPYEASSEVRELAAKAVEVFRGFFASVDIFEHPERGFLVNEVNGVPEFKGFIRATSLDPSEVLARRLKEELKR